MSVIEKTIKIACMGATTLNLSQMNILQKDLKSLSHEDYEKYKKEIINTGYAFPIKVWRDPDKKFWIVGGTQSYRVLTEMTKEGWSMPPLPVSLIEAKDKKEAYRRVLQDAASYGKMDDQGLYEFLQLADMSMDDFASSFRTPEIDHEEFEKEFFEEIVGETGTEDEVPEVKESFVKLGDLWRLGDHRLLCGDSTDSTLVSTLVGQERMDMVFTDPPYGLGDKKSFNKDHKDYEDDVAFDLTKLTFDSDFVIWGANYYDYLPKPRTEIGWVVWDKRPSRDTWDQDTRDAADRIFGQHFEIAVTNVKGMRGKMIRKTWGGFYGTAGKPEDAIVHKTQKPIELLTHFIADNHKNILDYFGGSGSTLIACEKTKRKCYMMELDPHYCSAIIERWQEYTGQKAEKIN